MKIKSNAVSLNEQNYHRLVEESDDLWIIEVYDETSEYCHRYSPIWEEIVNQFKGFVKFGRIDSWYQP
jgi:thioredoxin-like negative regulator of GroEL